jgi:hypothetical protein
MALGTNVQRQFFIQRGMCNKSIPAAALHFKLVVGGMNFRLHAINLKSVRIARSGWAAFLSFYKKYYQKTLPKADGTLESRVF